MQRAVLIGASRRRGIVAVLVACSLLILIGALAFAVDAGYMYEKRHRLSVAAEAAAFAAASQMFSSGTTSLSPVMDRIAKEYSAANGFEDGVKGSTVEVHSPPKSGVYAGSEGYVEVVISQQFPRTFSTVFGRDPLTITGRAVAAGTRIQSRASILVLDPKAKNSIAIKGASLDLKGDLLVNSKSKQSMQVDKKGQLRANNVLLAGGIDRKNRNNVKLTGDLTTGADPTPDPLAGLEPPGSTTARDIADYMTTSGGRRIYTLEPGNYDGKIEFRDSDVVRFKPGTYVFNEEVKFKNQASAYGSGVTIFMEGKKSLKFETSGTVKLSPPKSGPLEGITIFLDPTSKGKVFFKKDADIAVSGTIYAPNGEVRFQKVDADLGFVDTDLDTEDDSDAASLEGETSGSIEAQIIARRFKVDKKSHLRVNGDAIGSLIPYVGIVE